MGYQVLARKWRPRTFEEVVGQEGVTRTLRNALASGRIAHAFVFAGARGVGKTTTARILAKALNCVKGPTPNPCCVCDMCVEIAEGRDLDVLEIDAATHTGVDNVREVIIADLAIRPARDRYKVFIIDEVHMLSTSSFNALLKSIEEPPPHVVFVMATTELHKIPETITSRSQVFEFRTITTRAIVEQLRKIADAEGLDVEPAALTVIARAAEGSLRDAESALDQVIAFADTRITAADVSAVLGLVGRDLLMDIVETVADEQAPRVFDLAARVVESGQDLRLLVRELARLVRDMMVLTIDPQRVRDPEFVPEGDVERLRALTQRFAREDLLRAFDLLSRAEFEVRTSPHPRYHLEMALLKWIHQRKLVPLSELIEALERGERPMGASAPATPGADAARGSAAIPPPRATRPAEEPTATRRPGRRTSAGADAAGDAGQAGPGQPTPTPPRRSHAVEPDSAPAARAAEVPGLAPAPPTAPPPPAPSATAPPKTASPPATPPDAAGPTLRERFLDEVKKGKRVVYNTAVVQAQRIDVEPGRIVFAFTASQKLLRDLVNQHRAWLEATASRLAGSPVEVTTIEVDPPSTPEAAAAQNDLVKQQLKQRALAEPTVQALLDVFTAEIRDVEELP